MHQILTNIHIWANMLFSLIAILLLFYSIRGKFKQLPYSKINIRLEKSYIILLYFGLILGIILYFFFHQSYNIREISIQELQKRQTSQFWAIEHFSVMVFALLIAQIGKIFTSKALSDKDKYKYALFYYGTATLIIFISMSFYLYYKFR